MTTSERDEANEASRLEFEIEALAVEVESLRGRLQDVEMQRDLLRTERNNLLASTSWRLTAPVRWLGHLLKRVLGRRHTLFPARLVDIDDLGHGHYVATDIRPFVLLASNRGAMPTGWVELTYRIAAGGRVATPSLFADRGDGTTELDRKRLPPTEGELVTTYLRLPDRVRAIRLDPVNWKGRFEMTDLSAREITRAGLGLTLIGRQLRQEGLGALIGRLRRGGIAGFKEYLARQATRSIENYENWRDLFWTLNDADRVAIRAHIARLTRRPKFSVVLPTYETPPGLLTAVIESVLAQLYPDWELCIADDASKSPEVRRILERYAAAEPRIKVVFRPVNGHISAASNSALELANGDYVALLDHDDLLTEDALYWMAVELEAHPEADLIYSDEDKIDEGERLFDPFFKPDWSPELFLSQNLINHLGVYRRSLVEEVGRFRLGFEGSQDYDLALRVIERSSPERIRHVPVVLYHWRTAKGSIATGGEAKGYAHDAARRAIAEHLQRTGQHAAVVPGKDSYSHRVVAELPVPAPKVSIVVPTRDKVEILRMCVDGLLERTDYPDWELIVVDNGSREAATRHYLERIAEDPRIRVLRDDGPFNFSRLNNRAVAGASGELVLLLNNDIEPINPEWLTEMVRELCRPGIGAVGAKLYYPDDTVQHVGVTTGIGGVAGHFEKRLPREAGGYFQRPNLVHNASAVTAACLLTTKALYDQVGGLDEADLAVAFNDVDFCLKIRAAGLRIVVTPYAELYHHESVSRGSDNAPEKLERFLREARTMRERWAAVIDEDPYWNPNLHIDSETPTLGFPPRIQKPWRQPQGTATAGAQKARVAG